MSRTPQSLTSSQLQLQGSEFGVHAPLKNGRFGHQNNEVPIRQF